MPTVRNSGWLRDLLAESATLAAADLLPRHLSDLDGRASRRDYAEEPPKKEAPRWLPAATQRPWRPARFFRSSPQSSGTRLDRSFQRPVDRGESLDQLRRSPHERLASPPPRAPDRPP